MRTSKIFSVRLDPETGALLLRLAAYTERSRGDVIKRLIRDAGRKLPLSPAGQPHDETAVNNRAQSCES